MGGSITKDKDVNIESAVNSRFQTFNDIDFYEEKCNRLDVNWWNVVLSLL